MPVQLVWSLLGFSEELYRDWIIIQDNPELSPVVITQGKTVTVVKWRACETVSQNQKYLLNHITASDLSLQINDMRTVLEVYGKLNKLTKTQTHE